MSYPIQTQVFSVFLGTQEGIHSVALPAIYSSSGSRNLWIDKLGRAKKIPGYSKQNSSAVTTNTGSAATRLRALRAYRKTDSDGTFTRQLIGVFEAASSEYELWYSTNDGAAWTFIIDLGSGSVGSIPDFSQVDNTLFFANGVVAPRAWNGSALSTAGPSANRKWGGSPPSVEWIGAFHRWSLGKVPNSHRVGQHGDGTVERQL